MICSWKSRPLSGPERGWISDCTTVPASRMPDAALQAPVLMALRPEQQERIGAVFHRGAELALLLQRTLLGAPGLREARGDQDDGEQQAQIASDCGAGGERDEDPVGPDSLDPLFVEVDPLVADHGQDDIPQLLLVVGVLE